MDVKLCNECGRSEEVYEVELRAVRLEVAAGSGVTLAKPLRAEAKGDLCATCLRVLEETISAETLGPHLRAVPF